MNYYKICFGYLGCVVVCNTLMKIVYRLYKGVASQRLSDYKIESSKLPIKQEKDENYVLFDFNVLNGDFNLFRTFINKGFKVLILASNEKKKELNLAGRENISIITYNENVNHETFSAELNEKLNYYNSGHRRIRVYVNSPFSELDITSQLIMLKLVISKMLLQRGKALILGISAAKDDTINNKLMKTLHNSLSIEYFSKIDIIFISHNFHSLFQLKNLNIDQINLWEKNHHFINNIIEYIKYYSQKVIKS